MYKRIIFLILILTLVSSCGKTDSKKKIKEKIGKYKEKITTLQTDIHDLEKQLNEKKEDINGDGIPVKVSKIAYRHFEHFFTVNGSVEAVDEAFISPEVPGQIEIISVKEGERVNRGDLLVKLNSKVIESTISELRTSLSLAKVIFKKRSDLWKKKIGSEIQYLESKNRVDSLQKKIATLSEQLKLYKITAPFSGIVDNISKKRGELASPGMPLMFIVNLNKVYITSDVSEMYISKIKINDSAKVSFPSFPAKERDAKIYQIGTVVNSQNRTFKIKLLLDNKDELLKPNLISTIKLKDFYSKKAVVVPSIIVKNDIKGAFLYIVSEKKGAKIAKKIYVETGMASDGDLMIKSGLNPGDLLIKEGYSLVKNGSKIKIIK